MLTSRDVNDWLHWSKMRYIDDHLVFFKTYFRPFLLIFETFNYPTDCFNPFWSNFIKLLTFFTTPVYFRRNLGHEE
jgi:hypothetical protein